MTQTHTSAEDGRHAPHTLSMAGIVAAHTITSGKLVTQGARLLELPNAMPCPMSYLGGSRPAWRAPCSSLAGKLY